MPSPHLQGQEKVGIPQGPGAVKDSTGTVLRGLHACTDDHRTEETRVGQRPDSVPRPGVYNSTQHQTLAERKISGPQGTSCWGSRAHTHTPYHHQTATQGALRQDLAQWHPLPLRVATSTSLHGARRQAGGMASNGGLGPMSPRRSPWPHPSNVPSLPGDAKHTPSPTWEQPRPNLTFYP